MIVIERSQLETVTGPLAKIEILSRNHGGGGRKRGGSLKAAYTGKDQRESSKMPTSKQQLGENGPPTNLEGRRTTDYKRLKRTSRERSKESNGQVRVEIEFKQKMMGGDYSSTSVWK